jgi:hypothetical protein
MSSLVPELGSPLAASTAQLTLDLPAPPATGETPLVPVRMVNEFVYCPRLAFLEWVDGEWADSEGGLIEVESIRPTDNICRAVVFATRSPD